MNIVEAYRKAVEIGATKIQSKSISYLTAEVKHSKADTRLVTTLGSDCLLANGGLTANDIEVILPKVDFMTAWKYMENTGKPAKFKTRHYRISCGCLTNVTSSSTNAILWSQMIHEKEWELL